MNRRKFFNVLGSSIIGAAIALKIPNTLIPQLEMPEHNCGFDCQAYMRYVVDAFQNQSPLYDRLVKNLEA